MEQIVGGQGCQVRQGPCDGYTRAMRSCDLEAALDRLQDEPDSQRRRLIALGLLTKLLSAHGIEPILVGGGALEFYTAGGYATKDMDLALPAAPEVDAAFAALGFEKEGRYWYQADLDLLFEAPAPAGLPGEDAPRTEVEIDGLRVVIIGIEDLADRPPPCVGPLEERRGRPVDPTARATVSGPNRLALCSRAHRRDSRRGRGPLQSRARGVPAVIDYDEFQGEVRRRKRERWANILATEPPGRAAGRRPRDPEQERMLLRLDRARLEKRGPIPMC